MAHVVLDAHLVVAPALYLLTEKSAANLTAFTARGGISTNVVCDYVKPAAQLGEGDHGRRLEGDREAVGVRVALPVHLELVLDVPRTEPRLLQPAAGAFDHLRGRLKRSDRSLSLTLRIEGARTSKVDLPKKVAKDLPGAIGKFVDDTIIETGVTGGMRAIARNRELKSPVADDVMARLIAQKMGFEQVYGVTVSLHGSGRESWVQVRPPLPR